MCHKLCMQSLGYYLPVAGNIGVFCHDGDEYAYLTKLRETLTDTRKSVYGKYFFLHSPITVPVSDGVPGATYTYLYIRKPDVNKPHVGDIDFFMETAVFTQLKMSVTKNVKSKGMRILDRPDLDLIELYDADIDTLGYIGTQQFR